MKKLAVVFLVLFTVVSAKAGSQETRGHFHHDSALRPRFTGTHFTARSDDRFHRHFRFGTGGVVIFDPFDYGSSYGLPEDNTVYQGQVAPQDAESLPYGAPTLDPNIVISPFEPHAAISVVGIPHGAQVQDPVSNQVFLNP
jgi:hypothetical protein